MASEPGLVETYRGGVAAWECDAFGHLNIAFYGERFADAALDLLERQAPGTRWRTLALDISYARELRAGDGFVIRSGVVAAERGAFRVAHEASNGATGARVTMAEQVLAPEAGQAAAIAPMVAAWERLPARALPAGEGSLATGRDRVRPRETEEGRLSLLAMLHRFSTACLLAVDAIGMTESYRRSAGRGFATFETRLELGAPAAAGDGLVIASGFAAIGTSSLAMVHRMRASRDGRLVAQLFQAGVHFDLAARRSAPWPEALRDKALAFVVPAP